MQVPSTPNQEEKYLCFSRVEDLAAAVPNVPELPPMDLLM